MRSCSQSATGENSLGREQPAHLPGTFPGNWPQTTVAFYQFLHCTSCTLPPRVTKSVTTSCRAKLATYKWGLRCIGWAGGMDLAQLWGSNMPLLNSNADSDLMAKEVGCILSVCVWEGSSHAVALA